MQDAKAAEAQDTTPARDESGWLHVLRDAFPRNPYGIVPVTWHLVRAPFATIIRLADDPKYGAYWGLLLALTGATVIALFVSLPRLYNFIIGTEIISVASEAQRLRLRAQLVQLIAIVVSLPLQYYACRALSPSQRTPRAYAKMFVLVVCYSLLVRIAFGGAALLAGLTLTFAHSTVRPSTVIAVEFGAATLVGLAVSFEAHRRFWRMDWWKLALLFAVFVLLGWKVINPIIVLLGEALDRSY